jgi:predicted nucleic acid-binding protein
MRPFVLDASVALGWILDNPVPVQATRARQALLSGSRAVVPALWHLEIANGLAVAERRLIVSAPEVAFALQQLEELCAQSLDVEAEVVPMRQALSTSRSYRLTAYDAVYLDLARRTNMPLATLDGALRAAAVKAGVELLH